MEMILNTIMLLVTAGPKHGRGNQDYIREIISVFEAGI